MIHGCDGLDNSNGGTKSKIHQVLSRLQTFKYGLPDCGDSNLLPVPVMRDSTCLIRPGMDAIKYTSIKVSR